MMTMVEVLGMRFDRMSVVEKMLGMSFKRNRKVGGTRAIDAGTVLILMGDICTRLGGRVSLMRFNREMEKWQV